MNVRVELRNALHRERASRKKIDVSTVIIFGSRKHYQNPAKTTHTKSHPEEASFL